MRAEASVALLLGSAHGPWVELDVADERLLARVNDGALLLTEGEAGVPAHHRQRLHVHLVLEGGVDVQRYLRLTALKLIDL